MVLEKFIARIPSEEGSPQGFVRKVCNVVGETPTVPEMIRYFRNNREGQPLRRVARYVAQAPSPTGRKTHLLAICKISRPRCSLPGALCGEAKRVSGGLRRTRPARPWLVIVVTNENGGLPGALKLFIDMLLSPKLSRDVRQLTSVWPRAVWRPSPRRAVAK